MGKLSFNVAREDLDSYSKVKLTTPFQFWLLLTPLLAVSTAMIILLLIVMTVAQVLTGDLTWGLFGYSLEDFWR